MKRNEWIFEFTAGKLTDATTAKMAHHKSRLEFWNAAQTAVMADVREKGLSVETSLAGDNYSNARHGPQIVVDETFHRKLNEASAKIKEHTGKLAEYDGWLQVLCASTGRTYPLNADDYLFFFGK